MPDLERKPPFADGQLIDAVLAGLAQGRYHLVLGAGASRGCVNRNGSLPLAPALATSLMSEAGLTGDESVGLPRAFEAAVARLGAAEVENLLRSLFADAESLEWHRLLPLIPWEAA